MSVTDEFSFIGRITPKLYRQSRLIKGIGDDAAVYAGDSQGEEIVCMDTMVEDIHFTRRTMSPFHIGYKALASNISDIAAMGAEPMYYLVSIAIPKTWSEEELLEIYEGMETLADRYEMDLIGGDTVSSKHDLILTITVIGQAQKGKYHLRSHAKADDIVFVTGTLGEAACGLQLLLKYGKEHAFTAGELTMIQKHQLPTPQVEIGKMLSSYPRIALNDVSDGIASELHEIATDSQVTIVIEKDRLPKSKQMAQYSEQEQMEWMLNGGEDYELVGTMSEEDWQKVKKEARQKGFKITKIGYVQKGTANVFLKQDGKYTMVEKRGYNHFR